VAGAIFAALENGRPAEIYNAVDDEPVSQFDFFRWLSGTLGKELPPFVDTAAAERKRGGTNKRVSNGKLRDELGYQFKYPTFREGYGAGIGV
jgi:nucleoside-diphosphate-sugar epimerase